MMNCLQGWVVQYKRGNPGEVHGRQTTNVDDKRANYKNCKIITLPDMADST